MGLGRGGEVRWTGVRLTAFVLFATSSVQNILNCEIIKKDDLGRSRGGMGF
jgi:hypothetical protein